MSDTTQTALLRRMIRPQGETVVENPLTASRAARLALTKAADETLGLSLTVTSVADKEGALDELLAGFDRELMLIGLWRDGALQGVAALDPELRAAVLEIQTVGALIPRKPDPRKPTATDCFLCAPLLAAFLGGFPGAVRGTALDGWADRATPETLIATNRAAGLMLADGPYRLVEFAVDLELADRSGALSVMLPAVEVQQPLGTTSLSAAEWGDAFRVAVLDAPVRLDALLHRWKAPLGQIRSLHVGQVLALPGCTVDDVRLLALDGRPLSTARLGQMGGKRAVRVQSPPDADMTELPPLAPDAEGAPMPIAQDMLPDQPAPAFDDPTAVDFPMMAEEVAIDVTPSEEAD